MQFYKQLLWSDMFHRKDGKESVCPKILYSYLAEKALVGSPEMYNEIGAFDSQRIALMENTALLLPDIRPTRISQQTNLSRRNIYDGLQFLKDAGLVADSEIHIIPNLFSMGFIPLLTDTRLRGMDLILYSYLVWRKEESSRRVGVNLTQIDIYREKLAAELNTSTPTICKSLRYLGDIGLIKRIASHHNGFIKWWISFGGCNQ